MFNDYLTLLKVGDTAIQIPWWMIWLPALIFVLCLAVAYAAAGIEEFVTWRSHRR